MNPPLCVVLVGPEQAANVGFAARTMACYGLADLRIVGSPGIAADGAARKTGKAVPETLDGARYFASLAEAIADCTQACGFTRRTREPSQRIEDLDETARAWRSRAGNGITALVFGRESQGLFREETLLLTHLVRIPLPSETLSLNVSHALAIGLYAFTTSPLPPGPRLRTSDPGARIPFPPLPPKANRPRSLRICSPIWTRKAFSKAASRKPSANTPASCGSGCNPTDASWISWPDCCAAWVRPRVKRTADSSRFPRLPSVIS